MATAILCGQMVLSTQDNSLITTLRVVENINGLMVVLSRESGKTIKCMGEVFSLGLMEGNMKENILKTKSKGMELFIGQMVVVT